MFPGIDSGSRFFAALALVALLLTGCASRPAPPPQWPWPDSPYAEPGGSDRSERAGDAKQPSAAPIGRGQILARNEVNQSLVDAARTARQRGDLPAAVAHLERGISIAPQDPLLWYELALTRYEQGRFEQVENLAQRALDQAEAGEAIVARCWLLIADAREALGDAGGARQAREQARMRG